MEFFNKKEEVLDLQLTQYGKYLLSIGKLNPAYYTLHDDNVIYDSEFSQGVEQQSEARVRIQSDTPILKTQYNFVSLDSMQSKDPDFQDDKERTGVMTRPLATSNLGSDKIPSWNINTLGGTLLTASMTPTTPTSGFSIVQEIPQIGAEVTYYITPVMIDDVLAEGDIELIESGVSDGTEQPVIEGDSIAYGVEILEDGSSFLIHEDYLILQIVEDNAPMGSDNFEVEVFEVKTQLRLEFDPSTFLWTSTSEEELIPMVFKKEPILIVNDILVDAVEEDDVEIDSTFAGYYFDLELDGEISSDIICPRLVNVDKDVYKYAFRQFACPDTQDYQYLSPYSQKETDTECGD
jgi:hypothetical protein